MQDEIKKIVAIHAENIIQFKNRKEKLANQIDFYKEHNFKEEERIARLEFDAIDMIVYRYANMVSDIQEVLDKWNS